VEKDILMANIKISDLTAAAAASDTQEFEVNDSLTSKKVTGAQILAYVQANTDASDIGALSSADIGVSVQAYDVDTAKTDVVQSFSAAQRGTISALGNQSGTVTLDMATANNFSMTLTGGSTLANPTNLTAGQSGVIVITQDSTGSRTLAYGNNWKFPGGTAPTLTTAANSVDVIAYYVESSSRITARLVGDVK
jgi:hypothetical protein